MKSLYKNMTYSKLLSLSYPYEMEEKILFNPIINFFIYIEDQTGTSAFSPHLSLLRKLFNKKNYCKLYINL